MVMPLQIRRVITGHDAAGKAVVTIDNIIEPPRSPRCHRSPGVVI